jgi:hypothetical protein
MRWHIHKQADGLHDISDSGLRIGPNFHVDLGTKEELARRELDGACAGNCSAAPTVSASDPLPLLVRRYPSAALI